MGLHHTAEAEASGNFGPPVNRKTGLGWQFPTQSLKSSRPPLYHQMPTFTCLGHRASGPTQVRPRVAQRGAAALPPVAMDSMLVTRSPLSDRGLCLLLQRKLHGSAFEGFSGSQGHAQPGGAVCHMLEAQG